CTNDCPSSGSRTCFGSSYMVCGNFDTDSCLEWGTPVACPDNVCREPSCSGGACGETFVGSGLTDEACTGIIGCVSVDGGSCVCNGAGSCVSQPAVCIHECSPSGAKQCSGNSVQTCGNYDLDSCFEWGNTVACSGSTPYCSGGVCVQCTQASDCNDNNECTSDSCSSNVCSNSRVANGTSCTGGSCCSGSCDTTVGNSDFYVNCRNGPGCVGTSWQYNIANNGSVCSGTCTQCANGFCNFNNNSRCSSGQVCLSGTCSSTGCTSDSQCSGSTPYCNTANGQCVVCLLASHCSDNNPCTTDSCVSNVCTSTNAADNTSCTSCSGTSCKCQTGVCSCVPDCAGKQCGSNGCGGSCGNCLSYIGGNVCYDEGNCTNGICSYATNTLAPSANCCDHALVIQSSNCIQENIPNSSKCPAGQFCSSDCQCESNPCDSSLTEVSCNSMADCEWCPLISGCLPKDYVQCTDNAVCYTGNQVCKSNCRLSSCTGTNASCGCSLGECTICKADEACTNNYCISALLPMCIPNWVCGDWSVCNAFGEQARICTDYNACGSLENKPLTIMSCTYAAAETGVNTEFDSGTEETETSEKEPETESPSTIEPTERGNKGFPWIIGVIVFILVIGGVGALIYIKRGGDFSWLEERFSWLESIRPHSTQPKTVSLTSNQERTLFEYVHGCLASNYTPNQIREGLIRSGWPKQVVDEILRKII
ncbi:MAG TPA: hypothetical protein VJ461_05680, partial [Candidatus Nanoarchaeia archaeon]|nr:hypothetical protein [Candidatus Nanoarchaeia archaeon]